MGRTRDTADALGFQVRRDIHNRPYRELDRVGQRQMWSTAFVVAAVLGVLLGIAVLRNHQIGLGYRIIQLQAQRARLDVDRRHLLAERESLRSLERVERIATQELNLVKPSNTDAFVVERVKAAVRPSSEIVARR